MLPALWWANQSASTTRDHRRTAHLWLLPRRVQVGLPAKALGPRRCSRLQCNQRAAGPHTGCAWLFGAKSPQSVPLGYIPNHPRVRRSCPRGQQDNRLIGEVRPRGRDNPALHFQSARHWPPQHRPGLHMHGRQALTGAVDMQQAGIDNVAVARTLRCCDQVTVLRHALAGGTCDCDFHGVCTQVRTVCD